MSKFPSAVLEGKLLRLKRNSDYRVKRKLALRRGQQKTSDALGGETIPGTSNHSGGGLRLLQEEIHMLEKLVLGDVLGSFENVSLGDLSKAELVNLNESPESDEPNKRMVRQKIKRLRKSRLEERHLLLDNTGVDDEHEHRRHRR